MKAAYTTYFVLSSVLVPAVGAGFVTAVGARAASAQQGSLQRVQAQGSSQRNCTAGTAVADLGVTYIADAFEAEPQVASVDPRGPAAMRVAQGDYITRVNGFAITSPQAAEVLREARPGQNVVLSVRRGTRIFPVTIVPTRVHCSAVGWLQPSRVSAPAVASGYVLDAMPGVRAAQPSRAPLPSGWLGLGFSCSDCEVNATAGGPVWSFRENPTIYNVDPGSPAYVSGIRRGDVLMKVDGTDVMNPRAGARLVQVRPGETLRLTYRRGTRVADANVKVGRSPGNTVALDKAAAQDLLRTTQDLRVAEQEALVIRMLAELEESRAAQQATLRALGRSLDELRSEDAKEARALLSQHQRAQDQAFRDQQQMLTSVLRNKQEMARNLGQVEQRLTEVARSSVRTATTEGYQATRVPMRSELRYSGTFGSSDVEVRGAGFVDVQRNGEELVIITGDAVVRVTNRKPRADGN